jgi:probable F420-dependent oxidoreductase
VERFGITIPGSAPLHEELDFYRELESIGYTDFWTPEVDGADGFVPLALAAAVTTDVRLGIAIAPAFTRGPALLAQTASAMADAAPGRFVLGIGTSSKVIVEGWNAVPFASPYQRVRDVVRFVREALKGTKVSGEYETFTVKGFRLSRVPEQQPPIFVAGLRGGMLRLAGRVGDGAIINWLSADDVRQVAAEVHSTGPDAEIVCRIPVCVTEDREAARDAVRFLVNAQLNIPVYAAFQEWLGRADVLAPMWDAWRSGDRKGALALVPDEVIDDLIVHGSPEACVEHIERFVANGVTCPMVAVLPAPGEDPREAARALARAATRAAA